MHHFALGDNLLTFLSLAVFTATLNIGFLPTPITAGQLHTLQPCCHVEEEIAGHATCFGNAHGMVYWPGSEVFAQFWKQEMLMTNLTHVDGDNLCFRNYLSKIFWSLKRFKSVSTKKCRKMSVNSIKTSSHQKCHWCKSNLGADLLLTAKACAAKKAQHSLLLKSDSKAFTIKISSYHS